MIILNSALTICFVALLVLTGEALHIKKTRPSGNARIVSLIEKIMQRLPIGDCPGGVSCEDGCCGDDPTWACCSDMWGEADGCCPTSEDCWKSPELCKLP